MHGVPIKYPSIVVASMDANQAIQRIRLLHVNENIDAVLKAIYLNGPMDDESLQDIVPYPQLIDETIEIMYGMDLIVQREMPESEVVRGPVPSGD